MMMCRARRFVVSKGSRGAVDFPICYDQEALSFSRPSAAIRDQSLKLILGCVSLKANDL
jgi:hypothetical protein